MSRFVAILSLALVGACDKPKSATPDDDEVIAVKPTPKSLNSCVDRITEWVDIPNKPKEEFDTKLQAINKECAALYERCGGVETTTAFVRGGNRGLVLGLVDKCVDAYCAEIADPKPKMCSGGRDVIEDSDRDGAQTAAREFLGAMLAADLGAGSDWGPLADRLAEHWSRYGSTDFGGFASEDLSLGFQVKITAKGFELQVSTAHKWQTGAKAEKTLSLGLLPAKSEKQTAPAASQWDYATLAKEAKALQQAFPEERAVHVVVGSDVPNEVQIKAMDALRGEGCSLDANATPAAVPAECVFWRQRLE